MPLTIRKSTKADVQSIARLTQHFHAWHVENYPNKFKPLDDETALTEFLQTVMEDPQSIIFLAGDPAVGYLFCKLSSKEQNAFSFGYKRLHIEHISVAPDARHQGHGSALIAAARALAKSENCTEITLDSWVKNTDAHAFFQENGFERTRVFFSSNQLD